MSQQPISTEAARWDARYRQGQDGWELGRPAPPLQRFLAQDPRAPQPPGRVLVPGCGRGHEAALLAGLGFAALGLDFSGEALAEARRRHGGITRSAAGALGGGERAGSRVAAARRPPGEQERLGWLQADLFDPQALVAALSPGDLDGVLEHTCFCAIDPGQRPAYLEVMQRLLRPQGWLLGLFWCHGRPGGPPWGSDPEQLCQQLLAAGFAPQLWEPAVDSVAGRQDEWLGLWRRLP
jgi:thiopurine S-methyltransferase